ncbi:DNA-binding transcriptional regulator, LysR family [Noviherbaspirillum humi]|uniref:DNA-binding transcriptional regulator, LysR family n=1 Tax=Noviherbaspirillum humi TaxID=1688639 RepID=A0A239M9X5_9BURK|nr:LysR family transcriptional regulator [Noviherbaspirillum humi]SNT38848.1 DNA-binding transcriptional regulator, LysR family [Noviherbaspirillum humi]
MISHLDLRLLAIFDEIYRTRSVSAAAESLDLGQPAVSVALSRLRRHFGDQLFVRTSQGMEPTPFAEELSGPVRHALQAMDAVMGKRNEFDPTSSSRTFRICMTDISQLILLPRLWEKLRGTAPGIRIEVLPIGDGIAQQMESGVADLAVGFMPQLESGFYQQVLFLQTFVCVVGQAHPRIRGRLTLKQFQEEDHAAIASSGAAPLIIEKEIARQGLRRRVAIELPNYLGAAFVAEHTDLVVTVPERFGELLRERGAYQILPVPFPLPEYEVKQLWHQRYHNDPGNRWLRQLILELMSRPARGRGRQAKA